MATENEPVETVVQASVEPATDDTANEGAANEGDTSEGEGETEGGGREPKEQLVRRQPAPATETENEGDGEPDPKEKLPDGFTEIDGETPRERALRIEATKWKGIARKNQAGELLGKDTPPPVEKKPDPAKEALLSKYKPDEINALREVLPVLAEEMGYVRSADLTQTTYNDKAANELDSFLDKHPEYLAENDKGNVLWERFKNEYGMYRQPADPKDFKRIFERIHKDIFGIKVAGEGKGKQQAAERKVQSAAHAGAQAPTRAVTTTRPKTNTSGLRLDMLKGFSDEDIAAMSGE